MRKWIIRGAVLVAAVVIGLMLAPGTPRQGVAVIGDEGPAILSAAGWSQALPLSSAGVTVVSVEHWDRLRYIQDMATLCGAVCSGEVGLVRVVALSPSGSHKVVLVNLSGWPRAGEGVDFTCLAKVLRTEIAQIGAPDGGIACAADLETTRTRWALPFGLGLI